MAHGRSCFIHLLNLALKIESNLQLCVAAGFTKAENGDNEMYAFQVYCT
jgi:hypothetical protein